MMPGFWGQVRLGFLKKKAQKSAKIRKTADKIGTIKYEATLIRTNMPIIGSPSFAMNIDFIIMG